MTNFKFRLFRLIKSIIPKYNGVMVVGSYQLETNAVELANYIHQHYKIDVCFVVDKKLKPFVRTLLYPGIKVTSFGPAFRYYYFTSKYIFATHPGTKGFFEAGLTSNQTMVNVWHGVGHKRIRLLRGETGIPADITVATSALSKKMFIESFGVEADTVFISGYPRNDLMLRAQRGAEALRKKMKLDGYRKLMIWLPTFRREDTGRVLKEGAEENNPFQVIGFDIERFNASLVEQNTVCLVKPHYFASENTSFREYSHIKVIDDGWIAMQGITLYHLLACTDVLVTDFSSVMMDYILLEKPVLCFSTDLENYKKTQGLYFEDIENWLPTELIQNHDDFFTAVGHLLATGEDPHIKKRREIRDLYFEHPDADSSKRLTEHVFKTAVNKRTGVPKT